MIFVLQVDPADLWARFVYLAVLVGVVVMPAGAIAPIKILRLLSQMHIAAT